MAAKKTIEEQETEIALTKQELKLMKEQNTIDHAEIKKDVCGIKSDVKDLKNYVVQAIQDKADRTEVDDLQKQVASIDKSMAVLIVKVGLIAGLGLAIIEVALKEFFNK